MMMKHHMQRTQKHHNIYRQVIAHLDEEEKAKFDSLLDLCGGVPVPEVKAEQDSPRGVTDNSTRRDDDEDPPFAAGIERKWRFFLVVAFFWGKSRSEFSRLGCWLKWMKADAGKT